MTTVKFANPSEFLADLRKDTRHVDRRIVGVAECRRAIAMSPVFLVSVVATARVGADIYRVERTCRAPFRVKVADRGVWHKCINSSKISEALRRYRP